MKFSDEGQTFLDCKGQCFVDGPKPEDKERPILCICPGLTSKIINIIKSNSSQIITIGGHFINLHY